MRYSPESKNAIENLCDAWIRITVLNHAMDEEEKWYALTGRFSDRGFPLGKVVYNGEVTSLEVEVNLPTDSYELGRILAQAIIF